MLGGRSVSLMAAVSCVVLTACVQPFNIYQVHQPLPVTPWERAFPEQLKMSVSSADRERIVSAFSSQSGDAQLFERVVLDNNTEIAGENVLVAAYRKVSNRRKVPRLIETGGNYAFRPSDIDRVLRTWLDDVDMERQPKQRRNRFGKYFFLTGKARDGSSCIYAWQILRKQETDLLTQYQDVALQMRACDRDQKSEEIIKIFDQIIVDI